MGEIIYHFLMKKTILILAFGLMSIAAGAQIVIDLPAPASDVEEKVTYKDNGDVDSYSSVTRPSMTVCLPDASIATGASMLIFPGGGLMSLSWDGEFMQIARFLNARGVAAIGVKYRTRVMGPASGMPRPAAPQGARPAAPQGQMVQRAPRPDFSVIQNFGVLNKANASPSGGGDDPTLNNAADDAFNAMEIVKSHASEWGIDPVRIGVMGFSAGGGVELAALMQHETFRPAYICTVYGPSLIDVDVPADAPKLYIAVKADHYNVAAGCLALFLEWKKAGKDAELHVYGDGTGSLWGNGAKPTEGKPTSEGHWLETFYSWMCANCFTTEVSPVK